MSKLVVKSTNWRTKVAVVAVTLVWAIASFVLAYGLVWALLKLIVWIMPGAFSGISQNVYVVAVSTSVYVFALLIMLFAPRLWKRSMVSRSTLGLDRLVSWLDIALTVPAMVVYFIVAMVAMWGASFLPWINLDQVQETGLTAFAPSSEMVMIFLLLVVIGPFVEELIFRGYVYGKIRSTGVPFWLTALIVSAAFAAAHGQWNVAIDTFVLSMVMCVMREQTGSIWVGVLMHMIKNGIAFYFLFVSPGLIPTGMILF